MPGNLYLKAAALCLCFYAFTATACLPVINWNDSISFCQGNSISLSAYNPNSSYLWSTGATTPSLNISTSGTYWVQVTNACGSTSDTITVHVDQPLWFSLGADREMCSNGNTVLKAPVSTGATYLWNDGSQLDSLQVTGSGTYWVKVTNGCGVFLDSVVISYKQLPQVNLGPDINACTGGTQVLQSLTPVSGQLLWSTGDTTPSISVNQTGTYWLQATNSCGTTADTIKVFSTQGLSLEIGDTVHRCPTSFVILRSNLQGGTYQWSTGASTSSIVVGNQGAYWLKYSDQCGTYYDTAFVVNSGKAKVNLGPDTSVCVNNVYMLDAGNYGSTYQWQDGSSKSSFSVTQSGTYWVGVNNGCGWAYDTVHVVLSLLPNPSIPDTVFYCAGGSVSVDAGSWGPYTFYSWSNGSTAQSRTFSSNGNHWVTVGNECDTVTKYFTVFGISSSQVSLGGNVVKCGSSHTLIPSLPKSRNNFTWSTGSSSNRLTVNSSGTYWVGATNACGTSYDTVHVNLQSLPVLQSRRNENLCAGGSLLLQGKFVPGTQYQWSNGGTGSAIFVYQPGTYYYSATNLCGTVNDTIQVSEVYPLQVNLGRDTSFCEPATLTLDLGNLPADSIRWSTGSRQSSIIVSSTGTYWAEAYNACGVFSDTIYVHVDLLPKHKLSNKGFCVGGSVALGMPQSHVLSYQWNTGASTPAITVNQPGWYYVTMTSACGSITDSAYVRQDFPIAPFDLGNDTIFCQGNLWLQAPQQPGYRYLWQDGSRQSSYKVTTSGYYKVTVSNTCNSVTDSILIIITGSPKFALGNQVRFCFGTTLFLNAQNPGSTYLWSTGSTAQTLAIDSGGVYWVQITNNCGTLVDTVEVIVEYPLNKVELGNDTTICFGQEVVLDAYYRNEDVLWSDSSTASTLRVSQSGTYWVRLRNSCGQWYDTIRVNVLQIPVFSLGNDTAFCRQGGSVELEGPPGMWKYLWSNGDTSSGTTYFTEGVHWLEVQNPCFSYTDSIFLQGEDPIELDIGEDTTLCSGEVLVLQPESWGYPLTWDNKATGPVRQISAPGTYWAVAQNSCGVFMDTINVHFDGPVNQLPVDTVLCDEDSATFDFSFYKHRILWEDGSESPVRTFKKEGHYAFTVFNKCGAFDKEVVIETNNCNCPVYIPNTFTPNIDGLNDYFQPVFDCAVRGYRLQIFDRWGRQVFISHDVDATWDGVVDGKPLPVGVYNFRLYYNFEIYGFLIEREKLGIINLIR